MPELINERSNQTTNVDVVVAAVKGGLKPKANAVYIKNIFRHDAAKDLARGLYYELEADWNDSSSAYSERQSREAWGFWKAFLGRLKLGRKLADGPTTNLTENFMVHFPTAPQMLKSFSARLMPVARHWRRCIIMVSDNEYSKLQTAQGEEEPLDTVIDECESIMYYYIGGPKLANDQSVLDVDLKKIEWTPPSEVTMSSGHLGNLDPDTDLDSVELLEASAEAVNTGLVQGDAPDRAQAEN